MTQKIPETTTEKTRTEKFAAKVARDLEVKADASRDEHGRIADELVALKAEIRSITAEQSAKVDGLASRIRALASIPLTAAG